MHAASKEHDRGKHTALASVTKAKTFGVKPLYPSVHYAKYANRRDEGEHTNAKHIMMTKQPFKSGYEPYIKWHDLRKGLSLICETKEVSLIECFGSTTDVTQLRGW